ncbi:hypothetical protein G9A89_000381 [Geosiphon pyriformis]|nr:hypothetical protein G9A89_000381 [Geosiphon pyriformis]
MVCSLLGQGKIDLAQPSVAFVPAFELVPNRGLDLKLVLVSGTWSMGPIGAMATRSGDLERDFWDFDLELYKAALTTHKHPIFTPLPLSPGLLGPGGKWFTMPSIGRRCQLEEWLNCHEYVIAAAGTGFERRSSQIAYKAGLDGLPAMALSMDCRLWPNAATIEVSPCCSPPNSVKCSVLCSGSTTEYGPSHSLMMINCERPSLNVSGKVTKNYSFALGGL